VGKSEQSKIESDGTKKEFPEIEAFLTDLSAIGWLMRTFQKELVNVCALVDVGAQEE